MAGLCLQAWNAPFASIKDQSLAARWGACSTSAVLAGAALFLPGGDAVALLAVGAAFVLVSFLFLVASAITAWLLRHREALEAAGAEAGCRADPAAP
jgi:hypothetical protein